MMQSLNESLSLSEYFVLPAFYSSTPNSLATAFVRLRDLISLTCYSLSAQQYIQTTSMLLHT